MTTDKLTSDEIISMAREAGFADHEVPAIKLTIIKRFAALIEQRARAEEREACANIAREWEDNYVVEDTAPGHVDDAIRARGEVKP